MSESLPESLPREITRSELQTKIDGGESFVLLETLPEPYYRKGHLPGALLMPHDRVSELAPQLVPSLRSEVVVYCASNTCRNSHQAAARLTELGYENVRVYAGGKAEWQEAGLPLDTARLNRLVS
jgi:rhodanese-related sulfurtransferase